MERGLLWLPLLGLFSGLAWAGWNEYTKLEAYKRWVIDFERAKYDIYAALGQQSDRLVWGRPTRQGPQPLQQVSLSSIESVNLYTPADRLPDAAQVPRGCRSCLELILEQGDRRWIPFTDADLASRWQMQLQTCLQSLKSTAR